MRLNLKSMLKVVHILKAGGPLEKPLVPPGTVLLSCGFCRFGKYVVLYAYFIFFNNLYHQSVE